MHIWKQLKINCQRVANFAQAAMIILIQEKGRRWGGGPHVSHHDPGGSWPGCWSLSEGLQILHGLVPGLVEGDMAWTEQPRTLLVSLQGAGLEDSLLPPESTRPMPSCYIP